MPDQNAIANAIAARYSSANVTPPAGFTNIRTATADTEAAMPAMPAVLVFPDAMRCASGNGTRICVLGFLVRFYFAERRDTRRDDVALWKWGTVLADQLKLSVQLGGSVPFVARVTVDDWRIGVLPYANKEYSGVELDVLVTTTEPWAAVA